MVVAAPVQARTAAAPHNEVDGRLYPLERRRPWAFREAGVDIPYRKATTQEIQNELPDKWDLSDDRDSIDIRGL